MSNPFRIVVVDDHPKMRETACRLLSSIPGVAVIGEAATGLEALEAVARLGPDLVLMDVNMPGMNGLEATRRLVSEPGAPTVIIMTGHDLPEYRDAALASGASRVIVKSDIAEQLAPAISNLIAKAEAETCLVDAARSQAGAQSERRSKPSSDLRGSSKVLRERSSQIRKRSSKAREQSCSAIDRSKLVFGKYRHLLARHGKHAQS